MDASLKYSDALSVCKGRNAKLFEPDTFDEGNTIFNYVKEKANSSPYIWINYSDIHVTASLVGLQNEPMFVNSTYVGSLSTLAKLPKEMWRTTREEGNNRQRGNNCIVWAQDNGVGDSKCTYARTCVCETEISSNLKEQIDFLNDTIASN